MTNFILNRGGAGKSITRHETAAAMSDLVVPLIGIMRTYEHLATLIHDEEAGTRIEVTQNRTRNDIAKLSEIILSTGGVTPRGADPVDSSENPDMTIRRLNEAEREFRQALENSLKLKHHYRTIAVLETLLKNTEERITLVREIAHLHNVPVG